MTDEELDEIEARADAATPGPWRWVGDTFEDVEPHVCPHGTDWTDHGPDLYSDTVTVLQAGGYDASSLTVIRADAEFIAHARDDIPKLVAEARRARRAQAYYEEQIRRKAAYEANEWHGA